MAVKHTLSKTFKGRIASPTDREAPSRPHFTPESADQSPGEPSDGALRVDSGNRAVPMSHHHVRHSRLSEALERIHTVTAVRQASVVETIRPWSGAELAAPCDMTRDGESTVVLKAEALRVESIDTNDARCEMPVASLATRDVDEPAIEEPTESVQNARIPTRRERKPARPEPTRTPEAAKVRPRISMRASSPGLARRAMGHDTDASRAEEPARSAEVGIEDGLAALDAALAAAEEAAAVAATMTKAEVANDRLVTPSQEKSDYALAPTPGFGDSSMIEPHTRAVNEDKTANALTSLPPTRVTSRSAVSAVRNHEKALALAHRYGLSNHPDQRDAYQELSHRLLRQVQSANCRRLALCLVDPTHGSTPIVGRLAASLASMKSGSIAMIETLARPAMAGLTIEDEEQVIDAILGRRAWREMVCQVGDHPFDVIQVPSYLLSRERLGDATRASAWRDFTNQYRLSLVDACSWETRPTPEQLPPVDGVVLLAGLRTTMRRAAGKAAEAWRAAGANILGTIAMAID